MSAPLQIALIGVPTDVGGASPGASMGPDALRVAGLAATLRGLGHSIIDLGNLAGPRNPLGNPLDGYRNLEEVVAWCATARDAVRESLVAGQFPVLLGGDHSLAIGSVAACAHYCASQKMPLSVLWLDAHADYNTPETTPTGNLHGMPLAVLTGKGPPALLALGAGNPMVQPDNIVQVGIRSVDRLEQPLLTHSGITVVDMREIDERGMRAVMQDALRKLKRIGGHLHVSLDVDFVDPAFAPGVATAVQGGPTYREAQLCMEMIHDSGLMRSLDVVELNPAHDVRNGTAQLMVDLAGSLFGRQILSRPSVSY